VSVRGLARRRTGLAALPGAALAGAALAVLAAAALPAGVAGAEASASAASAASAPVRLSGAPLGVNVAPWDPVYSAAATSGKVQVLLKKAGITQLHYGGGVTADLYDWQTDTDIAGCPGTDISEFEAHCATSDALGFSLFSSNARALGAQSFVTVNYGSGTPAMAAAWVKQASTTPGQAVRYWEVGNESYGCWEANNWLAQPPEQYAGYKANDNATCPMVSEGIDSGMQTMATSYAENAKQYMVAMQAQQPDVQLGVPWAFDTTVGGSSVRGADTWNSTVLGTDGPYLGFVEAHWYPFGFGGNAGAGGNPTDQHVIKSVTAVPAQYAKIRAALNTYAPAAKVIVGETGVSYLATNLPCEPAGALFAAGDALEWLAAGALSVDWWPMTTDANLGTTCGRPDEAMFTNAGAPTTPYTGYLLASALARPGASLSSLATSSSDVLAFQSVLPNGKVAVLLINTNTSISRKATFRSSLTGELATQRYSAGDQNAAKSKIVPGWTSAAVTAGGVTLPAESILVLRETTLKPPSLKLALSAASVRRGQTITVTATLGAPHVNKTLVIYAQPKGRVKKVIKRGTVNAKGKLSVVYPVTANTTFTVVFSGDSWYIPGTATAIAKVKA
jgi:hypothetical protein